MMTAEPLRGATRKGVFYLALAGAVLVLVVDQWTKALVEHHFRLHESRVVIEGFFSLTSVRNEGAAWSMFSGYGWLLLGVAVAVMALIVVFFRYLSEGYLEREAALMLLLSGIVGNSIDRFWRGSVVDFLDFYVGTYHWPVFNVADIAICTGVGLFLLSAFIRPSKQTGKKEESPK